MAVERRGQRLHTLAPASGTRAQHPPRGAEVVLHLQRPALETLSRGVEFFHGFLKVGRRSLRRGQVDGRRGGRGRLVGVRERVRPREFVRRVRILEPLEPRLRVLSVAEALHNRLGQATQPVVVAPQLRLQ